MKALVPLLLVLLPGSLWAHPGHLIEIAGHDHVAAGVAIGIAIGVAIWGALKGRRDDAKAAKDEEAAADEEPQEA